MKAKRRKYFVPVLEILEDRLAPAAFHVRNLNDAGAGSLRAVIADLNANGGLQNTMDFKDMQNQDLNGQINLVTFLPAIDKDVQITGTGKNNLTIARSATNADVGAGMFRIFGINAAKTVGISDLTIARGRATTVGGIWNSGVLTLANVKIRDCTATQGVGGAVGSNGTRLSITSTEITSNGSTSDAGGGVYIEAGTNTIQGTTLAPTQITSNSARWGGGIYIKGGSLTVSNTVIASNTATLAGAGIMIDKQANVQLSVLITGNSRIDNNTVAAAAANATSWTHGGGIYNRGAVLELGDGVRITNNTADFGAGIDNPTGTVTGQGSITISSNTARGGGGGILNYQGDMSFNNLTMSGNRADRNAGGAILNIGTLRNPSTIRIQNATIQGNRSQRGGAIADQGDSPLNTGASTTIISGGGTISQNTATDGNGGGLAGGILNENGGTAVLVNCIVAGNTDDQGSPDVSGGFTSLGHNLIGIGTGSTGWNTNNGDQVGVDSQHAIDPKLNGLGYYGGTTQTMTLQYNSPALDAGDNSYADTLDQRGYSRIVNTTVDIGAVEMQSGEFDLSSPYAYNVDFSVRLGNTVGITADDDYSLLDYSGNTGNANAFVAEVNGEAENVGVEIVTTEGGTVTLNADGTFLYTPPADFHGDDSATYTISDGTNTRTGTITFHVIDVTAFDADYDVLKNLTLTVSADDGLLLYANAASGDALAVTEVNGSAGNLDTDLTLDHGTLHVYADGHFSFTPTTGFTGDQTFAATVSDGIEAKSFTVTIHVSQVLATDAEFSVVHDHELTVPDSFNFYGLLHYASDADNNSLSVAAIDGDENAIGNAITTANGGTLTVESDGSFVYDPPANWAGDDWFSYTASDGNGHDSTATVLLHVTNQPPVLLSTVWYATAANTTLSVPNWQYMYGLLHFASDDDGDSLSVVAINGDPNAVGSAAGTAQGGSVTAQADGTFVYVPPTDFTGDDTFTFTISDGVTTLTVICTIQVS